MTLSGDAKREYQRLWIQARRDDWISKNGPYSKCGSTENLTVDHIDPKQKLIDTANLWSLSPLNAKRVEELNKCQVLCEECHKIKTKNARPYKCELCIANHKRCRHKPV